MIDLRSLGLQPGQKLRIKTKDEIVIGKFKRITKDEMSIEVVDIQRLDGTALAKSVWYYKEDIVDIKADELNRCQDQAAVDIESKFFTPTISQAQSDRIQRMMENAVYIKQSNESYYDALNDISGSFFIGLHAENADMGR